MITKITSASPAGECPLWHKFLDYVTNGDIALKQYLQQMVGYSLTGVTVEESIFFLYGTGANGKSVFLNVIAAILNDYRKDATMGMFVVTKNEQHPTDMASLMGARFVTAIEMEEGNR